MRICSKRVPDETMDIQDTILNIETSALLFLIGYFKVMIDAVLIFQQIFNTLNPIVFSTCVCFLPYNIRIKLNTSYCSEIGPYVLTILRACFENRNALKAALDLESLKFITNGPHFLAIFYMESGALLPLFSFLL